MPFCEGTNCSVIAKPVLHYYEDRVENSALYLTDKELQGASAPEVSGLLDDVLTAEGPVLPDSFSVKFKTNCIFILQTNLPGIPLIAEMWIL